MSPAPENWDYSLPWYHGSPLELTELLADSAITQSKAVARAFSHKPSMFSGSGDTISHNGQLEPGFIYRISEELTEADVYYADFPGNQEHFEWHVKRPVKVELVDRVSIVPDEFLSEEKVAELRQQGRRLKEGEP